MRIILDCFSRVLEHDQSVQEGSYLSGFSSAQMSADSESMIESAPISCTASAAANVTGLRADEGDPNVKLRVYITGGGCAGFSYGFTFDETVNEDDTSVEKEGVILLVDAMSIQYLDGSVVDYEKGLMGSRFVVSNPNAATTCGCGSSFSV